MYLVGSMVFIGFLFEDKINWLVLAIGSVDVGALNAFILVNHSAELRQEESAKYKLDHLFIKRGRKKRNNLKYSFSETIIS